MAINALVLKTDPWFGQQQVDRFDTIVLRANYNYSWARGNRGGQHTGLAVAGRNCCCQYGILPDFRFDL